MHLRQLIKIIRQISSLPEVEVQMWGDETCQKMFQYFTQPHRKYRLIQNKRWGAALLALPNTFEEYLKSKPKQALRTNRRRAITYGFRFESFSPMERLEETLSVNASTAIRQGKAMASSYLDIERLKVYFEDKPRIYGVFDEGGVLKAYAYTPSCGEVFVFSRLLGHAEDLDKGIMYLLVSEVIREMIERKAEQGVPLWAMYDTFFGASPGLRYFKERLGFRPYKVRWIWAPQVTRLESKP